MSLEAAVGYLLPRVLSFLPCRSFSLRAREVEGEKENDVRQVGKEKGHHSQGRELWTQEPFLISTFWFLGFNLQFTVSFPFPPTRLLVNSFLVRSGVWDGKGCTLTTFHSPAADFLIIVFSWAAGGGRDLSF